MADLVANRTFVTDEVLLAADPGNLLQIPDRPRLHLVHACVDQRPTASRHRMTHTHPVWHLVAVTRGRGSFLNGELVVPVKAPFLFLVSPEHPHGFEREPGDTAVYSEITFQYRKQPGPIDSWSGLLGRWTGSSCALPHYTSTASTTVEEIREITRAIVTATYTRHPQLPKLLQGYLAQSLFVVWRDLVADRSGPLEPDKLVQAQRFIEQHSHRPIGLEDVAAHVGWSPKHLGRAFKERFGLSPMSYRRTLSLERAAVLLRTSNHAIKGIASLLGFDDVQYFHRAFRKLHGVPPAQYRRLSMNAPGSHQHSKRSSDSA